MKSINTVRKAQMKKRKQQGISLLEILIALAIMAVVGSIALPQFMKILGSSKVSATKIAMQQVASALDIYKLSHGSYPTTAEGLGVLDMSKDPKDGWGHKFEYMSPGSTGPYDLISLGADGVQGGSANDADIDLANLK